MEHYAELMKVDDLIDGSASSDDAEKSKPHPDIFQAALTNLEGLKGDEAIAIGDTPYDAKAAGKIGINTIGVLCGGFAGGRPAQSRSHQLSETRAIS